MEFLKRVVHQKARVTAFFAPQLEATHHAWQVVLDQKKQVLGPLLEAERITKLKKTEFELEQRRLHEQAVAKAQELEDRRVARLQKQMKKTQDETKLEKLQQQIDTSHVHTPPQVVVKVQGVSSSADYEITVTDPYLLVSKVLDCTIPIQLDKLITIKIKPIKDYVKLSGETNIPGCAVKETLVQRVTK